VPEDLGLTVRGEGAGGEARGGFFHSLPRGRNGPKPKGIPRYLAAASCLFLVGCTSFGQAAEGAFLPPKPSPTKASTVAPPSPFAPNAPTGLPSTASPAEIQIGEWPAPNTYGRAATPPIPIPPPAEPFTFPERTLNVLLLGSDRRSGIGFRTDTILIASVQPSTGLVALISIPRDLYVYLPGYTISRINTAWIYGETLGTPGGGPQLLFDTVRYNLGVPIDRYALVEMAGFQQIVDILGGVDVRVACDFTDWRLRQPGLPQQALSSWALFTMPRGVVHLDGDAALWYARSRSRSSDFDRARRQHDVLRALYRAALRPEVLTRIPELYRALGSAVKTNGDLDDVLSLAPFVTSLEPAHLRSRFIGRAQVRNYRVPVSGAAVLLPQAEAIRSLLEEAFAPYEESDSAPVRVEVVPGSTLETAELVQERLLYAGFDAVITESDPSPDGVSHVMAPADAPPEAGERLLSALGLPSQVLTAWPASESSDTYRLLLGEDYDPCFDPSALAASG
jgi:LCP family protein required for cell wall assembly